MKACESPMSPCCFTLCSSGIEIEKEIRYYHRHYESSWLFRQRKWGDVRASSLCPPPPLILGSICGKFQHHPNPQRCLLDNYRESITFAGWTLVGLDHGLDSISLNSFLCLDRTNEMGKKHSNKSSSFLTELLNGKLLRRKMYLGCLLYWTYPCHICLIW